MKKITLMMTVVGMTLMSYCGGVAWKVKADNIYTGEGNLDVYSGLAYVINQDSVSKAMMYDFICAGNDITTSSGYAWTVDVHNGSISTDYLYGQSQNKEINYYFVLIDDRAGVDAVYFSTTRPAWATSSDYGRIFFGTQQDWSINKPSSAFNGDPGWYARSVPEPTSGILLLFGVCACALKRKV